MASTPTPTFASLAMTNGIYAQLRLCLDEARELGLGKVLVCCASTNAASRKVILTNGGKFESTVFGEESGLYVERYWIAL